MRYLLIALMLVLPAVPVRAGDGDRPTGPDTTSPAKPPEKPADGKPPEKPADEKPGIEIPGFGEHGDASEAKGGGRRGLFLGIGAAVVVGVVACAAWLWHSDVKPDTNPVEQPDPLVAPVDVP